MPGLKQSPKDNLKHKTTLEGNPSCLRKLKNFFLLQSQLNSSYFLFTSDSNKCFKPNLEQLVFQKLLEHKENISFGAIPK